MRTGEILLIFLNERRATSKSRTIHLYKNYIYIYIYIYLRSTQYVIKHDIKKLFICCYCEFVHPENVVKSKDNQQQKSV